MFNIGLINAGNVESILASTFVAIGYLPVNLGRLDSFQENSKFTLSLYHLEKFVHSEIWL